MRQSLLVRSCVVERPMPEEPPLFGSKYLVDYICLWWNILALTLVYIVNRVGERASGKGMGK